MRGQNLINNTDSQKVYRFRNGYGASIVRNNISYGHEFGLWELAVLRFNDDGSCQLCYDTEITDNVIGYLDEQAVDELLEEISKL